MRLNMFRNKMASSQIGRAVYCHRASYCKSRRSAPWARPLRNLGFL